MTKPKIAPATGVTSQDGAYSAELLLDKGYVVHGVKRRPGLSNADCIDPLYRDPHVEHQRFKLHYGGPADSTSLIRILGLGNRTRFCQTSATEFYGLVQQTPRAETTSFLPRSPYAVANLYTCWITVNYPRPMAWMPSVESPNPASGRDLRPGQDRTGDCAHRAGPSGLPVPGHPAAPRRRRLARDRHSGICRRQPGVCQSRAGGEGGPALLPA
jgi:hypothetical protein